MNTITWGNLGVCQADAQRKDRELETNIQARVRVVFALTSHLQFTGTKASKQANTKYLYGGFYPLPISQFLHIMYFV